LPGLAGTGEPASMIDIAAKTAVKFIT